MSSLRQTLGRQADLVLVFLTIGILIVLFTPIPSRLLDFLILTNFSLALLLLLLTFYTESPVQFSTFPSLLLIATLFRLSLNVAATRLILSSADAGRVINTVGSYVVGGNYVIGLIVFLILVVVQYVVITNGAQRVAEVAARFTLDSMPGQQMSIDADLNMGFIDQAEAQRRRKNIEKEANFYGAMDGASKFVKGDAIAGIVILIINILGGLAIGVMQAGMKWDEALRTYTLLTIGDGIVTQVPALVIALGTGIIVTRSSSDDNLSAEVYRQLSLFPRTLGIIMLALLILMFLPGLPALPLLGLMLLFGVAWRVARAKKPSEAADAASGTDAGSAPASEDLYEMLPVDPIEVRIGQELVPLLGDGNAALMERIAAFRKAYALEAGFVLPAVRIRDERRLPPAMYDIQIYGNRVAEGELVPGRLLGLRPGGEGHALRGIETRDPSYGLPAVWLLEEQRTEARQAGYTLVDPVTVFLTHLSEVLRKGAALLLSRAEVERLLGNIRKTNTSLVEELIPATLSLSEVQKVLQNLLQEKVSIRNLALILEVLADGARGSRDPAQLTELVRQRLGGAICQSLLGKGSELQVLTLDPTIEQTVAASLRGESDGARLVLEPKYAEQMMHRLAGQVERMVKSNLLPVLLCAPELRRHLRAMTERVLPQLSIVSMSEVPPHIALRAFGMVTL
ncbi:flagellar biosynthesis protein FlhA [Noviherbaspirillum sp. DKR-6]|uniref:Flagellar biosynthesis protein FlhA n=2 Tax=Noviherbaspirillum pedocola TaxID=2801341 RepID=A0A934W6X7_9BURK|nr:flagellar biosynthesis protein FlhA [Noviherbaspirillum pedocola]